MQELTTIGDYQVRVLDRVGAVVRYAATHIVLPRRAVVELLESDAPRVDALRLMRRACILEALQHPAVPRIFECGRLEGRPWIAISDEDGPTLHDELQQGRLEVREVLTLLVEVAALLAHAHARGVLHGDITPSAIVRAPLSLLRWENAHLHDTELMSDAIDGRQDVFDLGKTISAALRPDVPEALKRLLGRMLAVDPGARPTASEVVDAARALRDDLGALHEVEVDRVLEALAGEDEEPDIAIEYPTVEDECILLERHHIRSVIVDLDACG